MMIEQRTKDERCRVVLGLSAVGMTYDEMTSYIGVGSRQRVQQLVVNAVARLPKLAKRLGVTGQRQRGRRRNKDHESERQRSDNREMPNAPRSSARARHVATARKLLSQHDGNYPSATEMMRLGHGALYQFMRKYPNDFDQLTCERRVVSRQAHRKRRRRRRF